MAAQHPSGFRSLLPSEGGEAGKGTVGKAWVELLILSSTLQRKLETTQGKSRLRWSSGLQILTGRVLL